MPKKSICNAWFGMLFFFALTASGEAGILPGDYQPSLAVAPQAPTSDDRISVAAYYWNDWRWRPTSTTVKRNADRITVELSSGAIAVTIPPPPEASYSTIWLDPLPEGSYQLDVVLKGYLYDGATGGRQDFSYPTYSFAVSLKTFNTAAVAEYYHAGLQHYFITASSGEMASLEAGGAASVWQRTGNGFRAFLPETGIPTGALPVCRFYGTPGSGPNSHFYTADAAECANVKLNPGWICEGVAFYLFAPVNGQCAAGQQAIYRVYNNRFAQNDSNHRYLTDPNLYAQMQAQGWLPEGVVFCGAAYPTYPLASAAVAEYYNAGLQHYFMTASAGEMASLDAGAAASVWQRTGNGFRAFLPETGVPAGALPVCRFYGTPGSGPNSHFYTADAAECANVKLNPGWIYEGVAFYLFAPVDGQCATDQQAVYRVYNNSSAQNDSNHRYLTDPNLYAQMQAQGWLPEGVVFCGAAR